MGRSYPSGSAKRKVKLKKDEQVKRLKESISKYTIKLDATNAESQVQSAENAANIAQMSSPEPMIEVTSFNAKASTSNDVPIQELDSPNADAMTGNSSDTAPAQCSGATPLSSNDTSTEITFSEDPASWVTITDEMREFFIANPIQQNNHLIGLTGRFIGDRQRYLTENHFYRQKCNNEKVKREWLTLSSSTHAVFCWVCKLFSHSPSALTTTGFCDWKHANDRLRDHENSFSHREAVCSMMLRKETSSRIDEKVIQQNNCESKYWFEVLRRVVTVIKYLAVRGLPFFGQNETVGSLNNGNFLGCLELIGEFDPFLAKHLEKYGNPGSGHTSYLSSTILNEFISLMSKKVSCSILLEIKSAKFYSIIVDSTPDLSHTDQLTFVVRYVSSDCEPVERFLTYLPICGHSSKHLEETVVNYLESIGLDIANCRGQSYDNASNMSGRYTGLQARIKNLNPLAEFVPCAAHSLNLVVVNVVECNGMIFDFFTFLQELFNFFSGSTRRWKLLHDSTKEKRHNLTLKSRSNTRWCANAAATKAVRESFKEIKQVLLQMSTNPEETPSTRNEANSLHKKMQKLETALWVVIWDTILRRIDSINKNLQSPLLDLSAVPEYFNSLIDFVAFVRGRYEMYEKEAITLVEHNNYTIKRQKRTPKHFYDGQAEEVHFDAKENFKISSFFVSCDNLMSHLGSRMSAYGHILHKFRCLFDIDKDIAFENAKELATTYASDLEGVFADECVHIFPMICNELSVTEKLKKMHKLNVIDTFANVETSLRLFLTLPVTNCTGERSFSALKRIKSPLRTSMNDDKLSSLALMSIESDITQKLDYEDVIKEFVSKKLRKKVIKNI